GRLLPSVFVLSGPPPDPLARILRGRLADAYISLWPAPEASSADPTSTLNSILEQTRVLVVAATADALRAPEVRDSWRRARQLGISILPVTPKGAAPELLAAIPGWMKVTPFFALNSDWDRIVSAVNTLTPPVRVPLMAPAPPPDCVPRDRELQ